jgi:hypothetical protein
VRIELVTWYPVDRIVYAACFGKGPREIPGKTAAVAALEGKIWRWQRLESVSIPRTPLQKEER